MDRKRPIRPVFIGPVRSFWVLEQRRTAPGFGPSISGQKTGLDQTGPTNTTNIVVHLVLDTTSLNQTKHINEFVESGLVMARSVQLPDSIEVFEGNVMICWICGEGRNNTWKVAIGGSNGLATESKLKGILWLVRWVKMSEKIRQNC